MTEQLRIEVLNFITRVMHSIVLTRWSTRNK